MHRAWISDQRWSLATDVIPLNTHLGLLFKYSFTLHTAISQKISKKLAQKKEKSPGEDSSDEKKNGEVPQINNEYINKQLLAHVYEQPSLG